MRRIKLDTNFTYFIQTQYSRSIERYSTEFDINGQRVIRNTGSSAPNTEADYVWVDIELKIKDAPADRTYYLIGAFNDWRFTSENRMAFDYARGSFRSKLLLKQGYYNYQFAELSEDQGRLDGRRAITGKQKIPISSSFTTGALASVTIELSVSRNSPQRTFTE